MKRNANIETLRNILAQIADGPVDQAVASKLKLREAVLAAWHSFNDSDPDDLIGRITDFRWNRPNLEFRVYTGQLSNPDGSTLPVWQGWSANLDERTVADVGNYMTVVEWDKGPFDCTLHIREGDRNVHITVKGRYEGERFRGAFNDPGVLLSNGPYRLRLGGHDVEIEITGKGKCHYNLTASSRAWYDAQASRPS